MASKKALYVNFIKDVMHSAPPEAEDLRYFVEGILPNLRPLSDDEYTHGPAVILQTLAPASYLIHGNDVYWLSQWEPGLIAVRFSPTGQMAWTALRSPIPDFGGRAELEEDVRAYDEDDVDHQYNLVYRSWDAQFDEFWRKHRGFEPAAPATVALFDAALAHANELSDQLDARHADPEQSAAWQQRCVENLQQWAGTGIRLRLDSE